MKKNGFDVNDFSGEFLKIANNLKGLKESPQGITPELIENVKQETSRIVTADKHSVMKARIQQMMNHKKMDDATKKEYLKDIALVLKDLEEFETAKPAEPTFDYVDQEAAEKIMEEQRVRKELKKLEDSKKKAMRSNAAENKAYDVSGETAEDLIDSAHPKKTKTELTMKPKDEGDVIETVVEQQEKDKAAVEKKPTGSYASLIILEERLKKAGLDKYADQVNEMIKSVVPSKIVVAYKINKLRSNLSKKGYAKYADEATLTSDPNDIEELHKRMPLVPLVDETEELHKQMPLVPLVDEQKPEAKPVAPVKHKPTANPKIMQFQKLYNRLTPASTNTRLVEDGLWGPKTSAAVDQAGGMDDKHVSDYANKIKEYSKMPLVSVPNKAHNPHAQSAGLDWDTQPKTDTGIPDAAQTAGYEMPKVKV